MVFCVLFYSPNITYWTTFSSSLCSSASLCEIAIQYFILWVLTVFISHWGLFRFFWCFIINSLLWASLYVSICLSVHASVTLPRWPKRKNARLKEMCTFIFKSYYKIVLWKALCQFIFPPTEYLISRIIPTLGMTICLIVFNLLRRKCHLIVLLFRLMRVWVSFYKFISQKAAIL